jgi:predicted Zn-dependent protease
MADPKLFSLEKAREAYRRGDVAEARHQLLNLVRLEPSNVTAWFWLADLTEEAEEARQYQRRAEQILILQRLTSPPGDHDLH